jgi:hypothetical protein
MTTKLTTCTSGSNSTNADLEVTASLYEREDGSRYIEATWSAYGCAEIYYDDPSNPTPVNCNDAKVTVKLIEPINMLGDEYEYDGCSKSRTINFDVPSNSDTYKIKMNYDVWCVAPISGIVLGSGSTFCYCVLDV